MVRLKYAPPALFEGKPRGFSAYITDRIKWDEKEIAARVAIRYTIEKDGSVTLGEVLQSTDARLRRRVVAEVEAAPKWSPAMRDGEAIKSEGVLRVQLPKGKELLVEPYLIQRFPH